MAKDDSLTDDDLEQDEEKTVAPKKKGGTLKVILIVVFALLLIGASIGGTLFFTGSLTAKETNHADVENKQAVKKPSGHAHKQPAIYLDLDPPFVVNFVENNQIRYLQVTMDVMAREPDVIEAVKSHMPVIRNNLVMVLSDQTFDTISTREGKQKLRDESLAVIRQILKDETGNDKVEAVYFTSFVMQ